MSSLSIVGVSAAIELNDETRFRAQEVHEVVADRLLATEFQSLEASLAQAPPKRGLGIRLSLTQLASPLEGDGSGQGHTA